MPATNTPVIERDHFFYVFSDRYYVCILLMYTFGASITIPCFYMLLHAGSMTNYSTALTYANFIDMIDLNQVCVTLAYLTLFTNINTILAIFNVLF